MSVFVDKLYDFLQAKGKTVPKSDLQLVEDTANYFGLRPEFLANLINFESGFSTSIQNKTSKATGLIQFMPSTAVAMGTTVDKLKAMTFAQQMVYVKRYIYDEYKARGLVNSDGSIKKNQISQIDLFMMIFYPVAVGNSEYKFPAKVTNQNPGIITPRDYEKMALRDAPFKDLINLSIITAQFTRKNIVPIIIVSVAGVVILTTTLILISKAKTK